MVNQFLGVATGCLPLTGGTVSGSINVVGNLTISNVGEFTMDLGSVTGGWAKGLTYKLSNNIAAGIGLFGTGDSVTRTYMGIGASPWTGTNALTVTTSDVQYNGVSLARINGSYPNMTVGNATNATNASNTTYATSAGSATNATKLNNQDAAYYLNYNNFTNKPLDRELVNFYNAPSNTTLNIPVIFGQSSTATTYNKIGFSRWQQGDPYGLGLGSYGNIIGWHGDDTGSFLATAHNAPVVMIGGINGTANQYKNWQRKVCLYGEDGVSFTSSNSNALGGVAAANYVNTSDTVILVGTI